MFSNWGLLLVSVTYVGVLFTVAWWGDRTRLYPTSQRLRPFIYSLALAVYCSSWTFHGAVGSAMREGLSYLPIYLGPVLFFVLAMPFFERLVRIAKQQNATSISHLLSARFGRSAPIAVVVTVIALTAAIPYMALQLKAVALSIEILTGLPQGKASGLPWFQDSALVVALLLAVFASLFGTRDVDATEHHPGMVLAIAVESLVKLIALLAVGIFAFVQVGGTKPVLATAAVLANAVGHPVTFLTQTLISFAAIFCLPRQFLIGVVECASVSDLRPARRWFSLYLVLVSLIVVPIAAASLAVAITGSGAGIAPDAFVLWLPLSQGQTWLAALAFLGGFSAATGMVIVASVALATMVSNDLVLPALWRNRLVPLGDRIAAGATILWIRRVSILAVLLSAYAYFRLVPEVPSLAAIGLLAFAAVSQFAPALFACVYWSGASAGGVIAGLVSGFVVWLYTLLIPAVATASGAMPEWIVHGPLGIPMLTPQSLLGLPMADSLTHGVFWSLLANVTALVGVSLRHPPTLQDRLQAANWMASIDADAPTSAKLLPGAATVQDLRLLGQRLLGHEAAARLLDRYARQQERPLMPDHRADVGLLQALERELAGALGAASARLVLTSALRGAGLRLEELVALLDETSQKLRAVTGEKAQAEQASLNKTRFLAAASHDLLQPLNAARLFNAALRARASRNAGIRELSEKVERSLQEVDDLIEGLLDISRLDAGDVRAHLAHFDAASLLEPLREQFAPLAAQRGIELRVHPSRLRIHSDPRMLRRILQNFVGNALRYTRAGAVVVACRPRGNGRDVEFVVIDTGPGIAPESRRAIFEEFHRLDQQSPWGEKGLGLGLSICERIAHIIGATLTLHSEPGHGSAFGVCVQRSL